MTSEPWPEPVEFRLPPDLYRMDTREGLEAYEASFRMKIKPAVGGEGKPTSGVMAAEDPAQTRAILG